MSIQIVKWEQKFYKEHPILSMALVGIFVGLTVFFITKHILTPRIEEKTTEHKEDNKVITNVYIENKGFMPIWGGLNIKPKDSSQIYNISVTEGKENLVSPKEVNNKTEKVFYRLPTNKDKKIEFSIVSSDSIVVAPTFK